MSRRIVILTVVLLASAEATPALDLGLGLFKRRQEKKEQKQEPPAGEKQWVTILQSDLDEDKRKAAAAALRSADPKANFDAVTALSRAVLKDPSPDVRAAAADSLGGFKVHYQQAATALEQAENEDPDKAVRAAAKAALRQYTLNGYKPTAAAKSQSAEPPLAKPAPKPTAPTPASPGATVSRPAELPFVAITQGPGGTAPFPESEEPPLAKTPAKAPPPPVPQKMPAAVPQPMPKTVEPPAPTLSVPPLPQDSSPLPLPSIPAVPQVPTVRPPK